MQPEKCDVHDKTMDRLFTSINEISLKVNTVIERQNGVLEFKDMVHEIIFGNGKPGLKGRLDVATNQINRQWAVLTIMLTALLTTAIVHFWKG